MQPKQSLCNKNPGKQRYSSEKADFENWCFHTLDVSKSLCKHYNFLIAADDELKTSSHIIRIDQAMNKGCLHILLQMYKNCAKKKIIFYFYW